MEADILITIALVTGVVLIINQLARLRRTSVMHRTIREAITRDSNVVPDLLAKIDEATPPVGGGDDRTGLILLALAAALALFGLIQGDAEDIRNMAGIALFPGLVGAVLLGRAVWLRKHGAVR